LKHDLVREPLKIKNGFYRIKTLAGIKFCQCFFLLLDLVRMMTGNFTTEKPTSKICKNIFYKSYLFFTLLVYNKVGGVKSDYGIII